jgi:hypothetical protein
MSPPLCRPRPSTQEHEEHKVEACDDDVLYVLKKHGIERYDIGCIVISVGYVACMRRFL